MAKVGNVNKLDEEMHFMGHLAVLETIVNDFAGVSNELGNMCEQINPLILERDKKFRSSKDRSETYAAGEPIYGRLFEQCAKLAFSLSSIGQILRGVSEQFEYPEVFEDRVSEYEFGEFGLSEGCTMTTFTICGLARELQAMASFSFDLNNAFMLLNLQIFGDAPQDNDGPTSTPPKSFMNNFYGIIEDLRVNSADIQNSLTKFQMHFGLEAPKTAR